MSKRSVATRKNGARRRVEPLVFDFSAAAVADDPLVADGDSDARAGDEASELFDGLFDGDARTQSSALSTAREERDRIIGERDDEPRDHLVAREECDRGAPVLSASTKSAAGSRILPSPSTNPS